MPEKPKPQYLSLATLGQLNAPANPGPGWVGPERPASTWGEIAADPLSALFDLGRGAVTGDAPVGMNVQGLGALLGAALPVAGGAKALRGATRAASLAELADAAKPFKGIALKGQAFGSLADTIAEGGGINGVYNLKPEAQERIRDLYRIGTSSGSNWTGSQGEELLHAFGGDHAAALKWARMWGATSPNTSVPVNTRESISALIHTLDNPGVPFTNEMARALPNAKITMAGSKVPNLNRALAGEPLSGDKVEAMAGFMAGDPRIPLDVHAIYGVGSQADKLSPELPALRALMAKAEGRAARGGFTETELYTRYEDALRRTLEEIAPDRHVNAVFADFWEGVRQHKGLAPQGGPIDILRQKGLLEFGAMMDPVRLRAALAQQGWTAKAIAGFMTAIGAVTAAKALEAEQ